MNAVDFAPHRPRLLALAYRMLGSVAGAEDMVQEAWVRWSSATDVETPSAWLTTVVTRLCLDELGSARNRRELHVGPWLPEPWVEEAPPEPGILSESLSMAFLLLLESLSPRERAAFLLREVFDEDYARIGEILGATDDAVRQWVRRAHQAIDADRPRYDDDPPTRMALLAAFGAACATGDRAALDRMLADNVHAMSDGGGRRTAALNVLVGRERVAKLVLGLFRKAPPGVTVAVRWVNGDPGWILSVDGEPWSVVALEVRAGQIVAWRAVLDPLKLGRVG